MWLLVTMSIRNLGRNRRRTLLTALTVALGTALLTVALAMLNGMLGSSLERAAAIAGHVRIVDPEFARREQLMPLVENLPDVAPLVAAVQGMPNVLGAYPHIAMGVTGAREDDEIGERFALLHGAPDAYFRDVLHLDEHLAAGTMPTGEADALVGKSFAEEISAKLGENIIVLGQTQDGSPSPAKLRVAGIVDLGSSAQNRQIWVPLAKAQWLADIEGGATAVLIQTTDYERAGEFAAEIRKLPALSGLDVGAWDARPPFDSVGGFLGAVKFFAASIIVFITGLGVLNTMFMSVLERTAEIGVMRALGLTKLEVVGLFFVEAVSIAAVGGLGGILLGGTGALILSKVGIHLGEGASKVPATIPVNETMYPLLTPDILVTGFLLGLAMALVGGFLPALRAAGIEPVEAMRQRR